MRFIRILLALMLAASVAEGQTAVYPYNNGGAPITIKTGLALTVSAAFTSSAFGTSGVDTLQIIVALDQAATNCAFIPVVNVLGDVTPAGAFAAVINDDHGAFTLFNLTVFSNSQIQAYTVANLSPYFEIGVGTTGGNGSNTCIASIYVLPTSLDRKLTVVGSFVNGNKNTNSKNIAPVIIGGIDSTGAIRQLLSEPDGSLVVTQSSTGQITPTNAAAVVAVSATSALVLTTSSTNPNFDIQNLCATPVYCGFAASAVTTGTFNWALAPDSVGGALPNGDSGAVTKTNLISGTKVFCITKAGPPATCNVAVTQD